MNMRNESNNDWQLLHLTGFLRVDLSASGDVKQRVDCKRLAEFCGVSLRTVRSWSITGLPNRARVQLQNLHNGEYLPAPWRKAGIRVLHDGVQLRCGSHINLDSLSYWQFIVCGVDWGRVRDIENMINTSRKTGRSPLVLVQNGAAAVSRIAAALGDTGQLGQLG